VAPANLSEFRPEPARRAALRVFVERLAVDAEIGVYSHERGRAQPLSIDVEVELAAGRIEGLADTLNYERIAERARAVAEGGHVDLVEEYAELLARALFEDKRVLSVRIRVRKPHAIAGAEAAGCEAVFTRP
jgi:dihydroneopterin aldolase